MLPDRSSTRPIVNFGTTTCGTLSVASTPIGASSMIDTRRVAALPAVGAYEKYSTKLSLAACCSPATYARGLPVPPFVTVILPMPV